MLNMIETTRIIVVTSIILQTINSVVI